MKKFDAARADIDLALRLDPLDRSRLRTRALLNAQTQRPEEAVADLRRALELVPDHAGTLARMGRIQSHDFKDYAAASASYLRAAELEPDNPSYWYGLSSALHYLKECETRYALVRYQRACAGKSGDACTAQRLEWAERSLKFLREGD